MSERKYPVITISREFGAGGHSIARVVSERLGIPYYDRDFAKQAAREFDSWISEKSTCRSHKTCFFCVKFLVFIYCILLQCVVKYNKGGILHASYYIEI